MSLSKEALLSALPLATKYDQMGLVVKACENTPLALLANATCTGDPAFANPDASGTEINVDAIVRLTNEPSEITGFSGQNLDMDQLVATVANSVNGQLLVAKTVVAPIIEDLVQRTCGELEQALRSNLLDFEIKIKRLPEPLVEPSLLAEVQKALDIPGETFTIGMDGPQLSNEQVLEHLSTGSGSVDQAIANYVAGLRGDLLRDIWATYFTVTDQSTGGMSVQDSFRLGDGVAYALVAWLAARKLWDNPIEGFNASSTNYERDMVALRDQAAIYLAGIVERQDRADKYGSLVISHSGSTVEVNEKNYREWVEGGGTNEAIFGACLSGATSTTIADLREKAGEFARRWQHFLNVNATTLENQRFSRAKEIVALEFDALWRDFPEDVLPLTDREQARTRFQEALRCTTSDEVKDLHCWMMRLITCSVFYKTDAFKILKGIHDARKRDPSLDVSEAAALAAISYIGWWVSTQLKVERALS